MFNDARQMNTVANTLIMLVLIAVLATAVYWLVQRPSFNFDTIEIESVQGDLKHVTVMSVKPALEGYLKGNFFTMDLIALRKQFETVPWVRKASLRRAWPNRLVVHLEEHRVAGVWNDTRLLNTQGESFTANLGEVDETTVLPSFAGPEGAEKTVYQRYNELNNVIKPLKVKIVSINLSNRYAWRVKLDNELTMELGRDPEHSGIKSVGVDSRQVAQRVERFVNTYSVVEKGLNKSIVHVDLRYPNGFAVTTKAVSAKPSPVSQTEPSFP